MSEEIQNELLTLSTVKGMFGVTRQAVMYWIRTGKLVAFRPEAANGIKTCWLVRRNVAEAFVPPRKKSSLV
jgi:hypothetical protein